MWEEEKTLKQFIDHSLNWQSTCIKFTDYHEKYWTDWRCVQFVYSIEYQLHLETHPFHLKPVDTLYIYANNTLKSRAKIDDRKTNQYLNRQQNSWCKNKDLKDVRRNNANLEDIINLMGSFFFFFRSWYLDGLLLCFAQKTMSDSF